MSTAVEGLRNDVKGGRATQGPSAADEASRGDAFHCTFESGPVALLDVGSLQELEKRLEAPKLKTLAKAVVSFVSSSRLCRATQCQARSLKSSLGSAGSAQRVDGVVLGRTKASEPRATARNSIERRRPTAIPKRVTSSQQGTEWRQCWPRSPDHEHLGPWARRDRLEVRSVEN